MLYDILCGHNWKKFLLDLLERYPFATIMKMPFFRAWTGCLHAYSIFLFFPLPIWTHHTISASRKRYFTRLTDRVRAILRYGLSSLLSCQFLLYLLIILFMTFFTVSAFSLFMLLIDSLSIPLPKNWCYPLTVSTSGNLF